MMKKTKIGAAVMMAAFAMMTVQPMTSMAADNCRHGSVEAAVQTFTELCFAAVALAIAISAIVEVRSSVSPVARPRQLLWTECWQLPDRK